MDSYLTPSHQQDFELGIKRSRFITSINNIENREQAKEFIQSIKLQYPDANHHCWAFIAGRPDDVYGQDQSDDGEPKGTAGKPMLNVLQHSGLGNIVVVVTRYFGGIKLGAGGLVRAYTQAVSEPLKDLKTNECYIRETINITLPYSLLDSLEHWLKKTNISIGDKNFTDIIQLQLSVPKSEKKKLLDKIQELGMGKIEIQKKQS